MWVFPFFVLKDPGGLTDYIDAEYIPDFLGGPYEVRSLVIKSVTWKSSCEELINEWIINQWQLEKLNSFSCAVQNQGWRTCAQISVPITGI